MNVLTLEAFKAAWRKQNPHDRVNKPKEVGLPIVQLTAIMIGVIAVNILSMAHTAPVIAQTVRTSIEWLKGAIGLCGVLGVEFTMFVFMYISMADTDRAGKIIRWAVILSAFLVAMIANISSTVEAMATSGNVVELLAAIILGAFAPAANLSAGEVLRRVIDRVKLDREKAVKQYNDDLIAEDKRLRNLYISYLKKYGITDPTSIMQLSSGEHIFKEETADDTRTHNVDPVDVVGAKEEPELTGRALEIYNDIIANGRQGWTQQALVSEYRTSPNTIAKIRKYIK